MHFVVLAEYLHSNQGKSFNFFQLDVAYSDARVVIFIVDAVQILATWIADALCVAVRAAVLASSSALLISSRAQPGYPRCCFRCCLILLSFSEVRGIPSATVLLPHVFQITLTSGKAVSKASSEIEMTVHASLCGL